ncbi:hypothetical protein LTR78_004129 [Recurvomyces mirabilis]|uniref:Uncharacterized protein n=1 Tax=Recurvomyces mirabilis TaxID=574656 RepID=A0AAE0WQD8_9PEZI|nr:hypothetical protein LTR78_004129 [Recurvomyces mirabilis]KAK5153700.1 hypothetical protein LTS14_007394 [Recurvomyces mirabilis]
MEAPPQANAAPQPASRPFRFLNLHAELRNQIYGIYAAECNVILVHAAGAKGPHVVAQHPISQVNQQLRDEFITELERQTLNTTRDIRARVKDFDFSYLIAYLGKVVRRDPLALFDYEPATMAPHRRRLRVELDISDFWERKGDVEPLKAWCRFIAINLRKSPEQNVVHYHVASVANKYITMQHLKEYDAESRDPDYAEIGSALQVWRRFGSAAIAVRVMARVDRERDLRLGEYDDDWYDGDLPEIEASRKRLYEK